MKKFLLLAAVAASFCSAKADYTQYFKLSYEGQEIANGGTVTVKDYWDEWLKNYPEDYTPDYTDFEYYTEANIYATNVSNSSQVIAYDMTLLDPATPSADMGIFQVCYQFSNGFGQCVGTAAPADIAAVAAGEYLEMKCEQKDFTNVAPVKCKLDVWVKNGSQKVAGSEASIIINFAHENDTTLGVGSLESSDSQTELYYNLQGVRVAQPEKGGLYIVRKGGKATKRIF